MAGTKHDLSDPSYCKFCGEKFTSNNSNNEIMHRFLDHLHDEDECREKFPDSGVSDEKRKEIQERYEKVRKRRES